MKRLFVMLAALVAIGISPAVAAAQQLPLYGLNEDGIHTQPWFQQTFNDIGEDMATAKEQGKQLVVIWEQQGCGSCKKMHEINFRYPQIVNYINKHFYVVQRNLRGVNEVTDVDGKTLSEQDFRARAAITGTPTLSFFPTDPAAAAGKYGKDAEAFRFVGYIPPEHFLNLFAYVRSKGFERGVSFLSWYMRGKETLKIDG